MPTGAPPRLTVLAAGAVAAASSASLVLPASLSGRRLVSTLASVGVAGALAMRLLLPLVAPAPMRLASGTFALDRAELDPVALVDVLTVGATPAYGFVAVEAPRGMRETVRLVVEGGGAERVTAPAPGRGRAEGRLPPMGRGARPRARTGSLGRALPRPSGDASILDRWGSSIRLSQNLGYGRVPRRDPVSWHRKEIS